MFFCFIFKVPFSLKCGLGWEEDPSSHYCYQFHDDQLSWPDARLACRRMGGDLASIHSREEQVYINSKHCFFNTVEPRCLELEGTTRKYSNYPTSKFETTRFNNSMDSSLIRSNLCSPIATK